MTVTAPRSSPSRRSTVAATAVRTWAVSGPSACPGRATMRRRTSDAVVADPHADGRTGEPAAPGRAAVPDAGDAGDLEGGQADELGDDALPDGQFRSAHVATSSLEARARGRRRAAVAASRLARGAARPIGGQRFGDELRDARPRHRRGHLAGVADHPPLGPAVGDDGGPLHAEQRRAADLLVVEHRADPADARPHEHVGQPAAPRPRELGPPQVEDEARQALEELDDDVAEDRVADDDVGQVLREVLALDVAHEAQARTRRAARSRAWMRASPLPFSSPIDSSATRGSATPSTRSAKIAPIRAYWARFSAVESGLAPMSSRTSGPGVGDHLDGQRRAVDAGQAAEAQDRGGHPGARVAGRHDGVGLAAPDEVRGDEDRRVLLLAQRQRRMLVHADDLGSRGRSGRWPAGRRRCRGRSPRHRRGSRGRRVAAGEVEGAGDDLGRAVVAAHRVDGDADGVAGRLGRGWPRLGHRVSAGRRRCCRRPASARPPGGPGSSRSSGRRGAAASSRGSADTPRAWAGRSRGASGARPGGHARRVAWVHPWGRGLLVSLSWRGGRVVGGRSGSRARGPHRRAESTAKRRVSVSPCGPGRNAAQRLESRVDVVVGVVVRALVERQAADRAQARAVRPVERGDRLGQRDRVADRRLEVELVVVGQAQRLGLVVGRRRACRWPGRSTAGTPPRSAGRAATVVGRRQRAHSVGERRPQARVGEDAAVRAGQPDPAGDRLGQGELVGQVDRRVRDVVRRGPRPTVSPSRPATFQTNGPSVGRALIGAGSRPGGRGGVLRLVVPVAVLEVARPSPSSGWRRHQRRRAARRAGRCPSGCSGGSW